MILDVARDLAPVAAAWACAAAAALVMVRTRAGARADREALRSARERESAFVEIARRLAGAARESVDAAVRDESQTIRRRPAAARESEPRRYSIDRRDGSCRFLD